MYHKTHPLSHHSIPHIYTTYIYHSLQHQSHIFTRIYLMPSSIKSVPGLKYYVNHVLCQNAVYKTNQSSLFSFSCLQLCLRQALHILTIRLHTISPAALLNASLFVLWKFCLFSLVRFRTIVRDKKIRSLFLPLLDSVLTQALS
jgi:hypothetical protein